MPWCVPDFVDLWSIFYRYQLKIFPETRAFRTNLVGTRKRRVCRPLRVIYGMIRRLHLSGERPWNICTCNKVLKEFNRDSNPGEVHLTEFDELLSETLPFRIYCRAYCENSYEREIWQIPSPSTCQHIEWNIIRSPYFYPEGTFRHICRIPGAFSTRDLPPEGFSVCHIFIISYNHEHSRFVPGFNCLRKEDTVVIGCPGEFSAIWKS